MPFFKQCSLEVLQGFFGVILFVFILQLPSTTEEAAETIPTTVQTHEEQQVQQEYFALQHGVFSNFDSAAQFLGTYPTLNKAAVVKVGEQYFVWSRLDTEKVETALTIVPTGFYKKITIASSCPNPAELRLPVTLKDSKLFSTEETESVDKQQVPEDWPGVMTEVSKLSTNPNVVRLHMFINYFESLDCLKVSF